MTPTDLSVPEKNEKALTAVEKARALVITTADDYLDADQFCVGLKELEKEVDAAYDDHIADAFRAHKNLVAKKKKYAEPIDEARRLVKGKMNAWKDEQDRIARAKAEEEARKAKEKADAEALARASAMEAAGQKDEAAAIVEEAVQAPTAPVRVETTVPQTQTRSATRWSATITNPQFVLKAIEAAGKVLAAVNTPQAQAAASELRQAHLDAQYLVYNQVALNAWATATKGAVRLGGVQATSRKV